MSRRRRLGQHFLVDEGGVKLFTEVLERFKGLDFLEVGPGLGALTLRASELAGRLIAVEIDESLAKRLSPRLPLNSSVVIGDGALFVASARTPVVFSNAPFYLVGRMIAAAARNNNVRWLVLGCQKEVAERIVARPGSEEYGRLSVISQAYFTATIKGYMPAEWFRPRPKVNAALVLMERRREWGPEGEVLEGLTRCLFSQKNRLLAKVAKRCIGDEGPALLAANNNRRVRDLTPDELVEASKWLAARAGARS
ncbi:MAG: 16S rRNA (adenine(1518)-N(6)/adenine(1519)-N(6))-dimethyltransferase RsmA [Acidilobus sp.]|nr:16S rRNA (adenine(1518)-N(6)/adenine(1519)-N(6))-dimethyltransferase RsmA [Acidilobus sp.]MCG2889816.1 16S rRNA (adenine(1518)-N(6)/adenine(1519)-N(6))-dimethyltransferase RsmA [Acidilobus sp.]MCG2891184.1 16S rRNA (adenine(1518)-N(6)/adenine(1519)-N(6))-dimethyltransferase RsmA [Acidilobus sp.]